MNKLGYFLHSEWEFFFCSEVHRVLLRKWCPSTIRYVGAQSGLDCKQKDVLLCSWPIELPEDQRAPVTYTEAAPLSIPDLPGIGKALLPRDLSESWHAGNCPSEVIKSVKAQFGMCKKNELEMWGEARRCKSCLFFAATRACPFE